MLPACLAVLHASNKHHDVFSFNSLGSDAELRRMLIQDVSRTYAVLLRRLRSNGIIRQTHMHATPSRSCLASSHGSSSLLWHRMPCVECIVALHVLIMLHTRSVRCRVRHNKSRGAVWVLQRGGVSNLREKPGATCPTDQWRPVMPLDIMWRMLPFESKGLEYFGK